MPEAELSRLRRQVEKLLEDDYARLVKYVRTLEKGAARGHTVDEIVADAMKYVATGVETGMIKPTDYEWERAAILTIWSLGALVLHEHLERLIGVDITADLSHDPKSASPYMAPALEIFSQGVFTETTVQVMREAFVDAFADDTKKEDA